jgi:hypothetical protein
LDDSVFSSKSITNSGSDVNLSESRFYNKYGEVVSDSDARSNLYRVFDKHVQNDGLLASRKDNSFTEGNSKFIGQLFSQIRQVARVTGLIVSTFPAVYPGPLHYRFLEKEKTQALQLTQSYQANMKFSQLAIEELNWWMKNVEDCNGKPIQIQDPSVILTTDASKRGWGAVLNGITTSGLWSAQEVLHINILELQAVYLHC